MISKKSVELLKEENTRRPFFGVITQESVCVFVCVCVCACAVIDSLSNCFLRDFFLFNPLQHYNAQHTTHHQDTITSLSSLLPTGDASSYARDTIGTFIITSLLPLQHLQTPSFDPSQTDRQWMNSTNSSWSYRQNWQNWISGWETTDETWSQSSKNTPIRSSRIPPPLCRLLSRKQSACPKRIILLSILHHRLQMSQDQHHQPQIQPQPPTLKNNRRDRPLYLRTRSIRRYSHSTVSPSPNLHISKLPRQPRRAQKTT